MRLGRWNSAVMLVVALLCAGAAPNALAAGARAVRKQIESSTLVTGFVEVDAAGQVTRFGMDEREKLAEPLVRLLNRAVPNWRFEPALDGGVPVAARTDMSLRIVARRLEDGQVELRINGATFGARTLPAAERVQPLGMGPPLYPPLAAKVGAEGTVYLLVKAGRDGKVQETAVEQVNLRVITDERSMERLRDLFAANAQRAAKAWTFQPPTAGESVRDESWVLRVPVVYRMEGSAVPAYGQWEAYIPGPRQLPAWAQPEREGVAFSPDALPEGGVYQAGHGLKLLTPPGS